MHRSLIAFVALLGLVAPARADADFGGFLAGIDRACRQSPAFEALHRSLVARWGEDGETSAKIVVPADLAAAFGPPRAHDQGDHFEVRMTVKGSYRGLVLSGLVFWLGKGNGISGYRVEFAETPERVRRVLGSDVARSRRRLAAEDDGGAGLSTGLDVTGGIPALFCDLST